MIVLLLCRNQDLTMERLGYANALERLGAKVVCIEYDISTSVDIKDILDTLPVEPRIILHIEAFGFPLLPLGLVSVHIPTVSINLEPFTFTNRRIRWSMLFDYVLLPTPKVLDQFKQTGHPGVILLSHAVDDTMFQDQTLRRAFEVGWVGRINHRVHERRRRIIPKLAESFQMNDWTRQYSYAEMAAIYKQSAVVVNISRDDYRDDPNLRCFEVMASGALLITESPTQLELLGFQDGVHFISYRFDDEMHLIERIRYYLSHATEQHRIAAAGRAKVLAEHTYRHHVQELLTLVNNPDTFQAPARSWGSARVRLVQLDYYAAYLQFGNAWRELIHIALRNPVFALTGLQLIARGYLSLLRSLFVI